LKLKTMYRKILFALFFLGVSTLGFSQNSGEIVGKLTDSVTLQPMIGAGISLERNNNIIFQTSADDKGAFYFKPLQPGTYKLQISFIGYKTIVIPDLYVNSKDITYINLEMTENSFLIDSAVEISWEDERTIISDIPIITTKELEQAGDRDAISLVAKTVPQVYSQDGGDKGGIYIAGSRADATLYVIDGIRVDGSAFIPKNSILEIVVYTGGIPAKYGDMTGGVIEITTKSVGVY
ncbi:MAG: carboxypeptidase regulatory-like domain-containing protein, partial [Chitinophagales bacterium]